MEFRVVSLKMVTILVVVIPYFEMVFGPQVFDLSRTLKAYLDLFDLEASKEDLLLKKFDNFNFRLELLGALSALLFFPHDEKGAQSAHFVLDYLKLLMLDLMTPMMILQSHLRPS